MVAYVGGRGRAVTDDGAADVSAAEVSLEQRVKRWEKTIRDLSADTVTKRVDRLRQVARERGPWGLDVGDGDMVQVRRRDLLTVLDRGVWAGDREWFMVIPDHHQLVTTSTAEGTPEAALLGHVALALDNLNVGPEGRVRILGYLLACETDKMKGTKTS